MWIRPCLLRSPLGASVVEDLRAPTTGRLGPQGLGRLLMKQGSLTLFILRAPGAHERSVLDLVLEPEMFKILFVKCTWVCSYTFNAANRCLGVNRASAGYQPGNTWASCSFCPCMLFFFFFSPNPQNGCNRIDPFGFVGIKSVNEASILRTVPGKCNLQFKVDGHRCISSTVKKGYSKRYRQTA